PNEIRLLEDMDPREGGDVYLTPLNMAINGKPVEKSSDDKKKTSN
ncbi:MAG: phage portal protein, partial [Oleispira sp.]|nr:phage portal protein [Oleispira sp.]